MTLSFITQRIPEICIYLDMLSAINENYPLNAVKTMRDKGQDNLFSFSGLLGAYFNL